MFEVQHKKRTYYFKYAAPDVLIFSDEGPVIRSLADTALIFRMQYRPLS
jgi:hypothetical protein